MSDPLDREKDHANNDSIIEMINKIFMRFVFSCISDISPNRKIVMLKFPKVIATLVKPDIRFIPASLSIYKYNDVIPTTSEVIMIVITK